MQVSSFLFRLKTTPSLFSRHLRRSTFWENSARRKGSGVANFSQSCRWQVSLKEFPSHMYVCAETPCFNSSLLFRLCTKRTSRNCTLHGGFPGKSRWNPRHRWQKKILLPKLLFPSPFQIATDPGVRSVLRFFRGHERAPDGSALGASTARSSLFCDKQATEAARQKSAHFLEDFSPPPCDPPATHLLRMGWQKRQKTITQLFCVRQPSQQPPLSQPQPQPSENFPPVARMEWRAGTPLDEMVPNLPTLPWIYENEWAFLAFLAPTYFFSKNDQKRPLLSGGIYPPPFVPKSP